MSVLQLGKLKYRSIWRIINCLNIYREDVLGVQGKKEGSTVLDSIPEFATNLLGAGGHVTWLCFKWFVWTIVISAEYIKSYIPVDEGSPNTSLLLGVKQGLINIGRLRLSVKSLRAIYLIGFPKEIKTWSKEIFILLDFLISSLPFLPFKCTPVLLIVTGKEGETNTE